MALTEKAFKQLGEKLNVEERIIRHINEAFEIFKNDNESLNEKEAIRSFRELVTELLSDM